MDTLRIDGFADLRYVNSVRVTPDAKRLVYSVITVDMQNNRYGNDLWTMDLATRGQRRLTSSGKEGRFDFMDDGSVLFASRRAVADAPGSVGSAGSASVPSWAAPRPSSSPR